MRKKAPGRPARGHLDENCESAHQLTTKQTENMTADQKNNRRWDLNPRPQLYEY
ncbi:MAG: hypothetical protein MI923_01025 [Phycisphaerales bacterium]|nr:hypothetical protein [Phycisphaerales bacterium]